MTSSKALADARKRAKEARERQARELTAFAARVVTAHRFLGREAAADVIRVEYADHPRYDEFMQKFAVMSARWQKEDGR